MNRPIYRLLSEKIPLSQIYRLLPSALDFFRNQHFIRVREEWLARSAAYWGYVSIAASDSMMKSDKMLVSKEVYLLSLRGTFVLTTV